MPDPEAPGSPDADLLTERFHHTLAGLTRPGQTLTAAFSGGLDSSVLLHLLARTAPALGLQLRAAHVHHGLQDQADAWSTHCASVCEALGVRYACLTVTVDRHGGKGIEAAARTARHAALRQLGGDWLVLAHHRGDQAETLLHRLSRGCGVHGAAAMRRVDPRGGPPSLLRPLLEEPRATLEAWAHANGLHWIDDPSNADTRFSRNFLRHEVLAPLEARLPGSEASLARAARHFAEAAGLLDALATLDLAAVSGQRGASHTALTALSDARLKNLLRARLAHHGYAPPDADQLAEALRQLRSARPPWRVPFGGWALCADEGAVWFEPATPLQPGERHLWQGETTLQWGDVAVHFERTSGPDALAVRPGALELRPRAGGERLRPHPARPARDIKTMAREAHLPPWWRSAMPVFWQDDAVVAWSDVADIRLRCSDGWHIRIEPPNAKF